MSTLSHVHQLYHAEACHAYLHAFRWPDHPVQCPHCHSPEVRPWGTSHDRPGFKRYRCTRWRRTFNDLTTTLLSHRKRSFAHWILATFLLCRSGSSHRIARELGVHIRTNYRWCWWLRNAAVSDEMPRQLAGTVEAEELSHPAGHKGQAHQGGKNARLAGAILTKIGRR